MIPDNFYGDNPRWFIATVVNGVDPEGAGRVQIRIHGIHSANKSDIPEHALPWAPTLMPPTEGGTSGLTKIPQLQNSAIVIGLFMDGQASQAPVVIGTTHQLERASSVQVQSAIQSDKAAKYSPVTSGPGGIYTPPSAKTEYSQATGDVKKLRLICMKWLVLNGYSAIAAAGICGNMQAESNFDAEGDSTETFKNTTGEVSLGIAQWNTAKGAGYRGVRMQEWIKDKLGQFWKGNLFGQLQFLNHELRGPADTYNQKGYYNSVGDALMNASTFEGGPSDDNATWIFLDKFENPAAKLSKLPEREGYARAAYEQYMSALQAEDNGA